ncbi:glycoside hydrolase family 3 N-terminal domain-containing protein [Parvularcula marina]|uniref:glycoside hydrolase family 3 protein n=1 Tax=Parvularcula marina TaxID=2292771 RepID=UPI0035174B72
MTRQNWLLTTAAAALLLTACGGKEDAADTDKKAAAYTKADDPNVHPEIWPKGQSPVERDEAIEERVAEILAGMTLEQKVGQVIQGDIGATTPDDVAKYHLGSVLNGGNSAPKGDLRISPTEWLALADEFWDASVGPDGDGIPAIWGTDAVHGHSNIIGATIFPHNIGLGAANDPELIRRIGEVTALEIAVTGLDWTFAPTVATPRDDRWGRTYEGYSEGPEIVGAYAAEMVKGLQGEAGTDEFLGPDKVISTVKHFLGDGGTKDGIDQGETIATEEELRDIHAAGYIPAINAGVQSAMASYSSWNGRKMHGNKSLLSDVLVDQLGFDGFVVGDWNGHGQIKDCVPTDCLQSIMAGLDMYMAPDSWKGLYESTLGYAQSGDLPMERLDEAVSRILRVKLTAGVWEKGRPSTRPLAGQWELLGAPEHRAVAREAVRKSLVLLKNDGTLPISPGANVLVTGAGANDMNMQTGGWTISWQGTGNSREDFPNADTIWEGIEATVNAAGGTATLSEDGSYETAPDVAIVVFGETPYAEFQGDRPHVDFMDNAGLNALTSYQEAGIPAVAVFISGRPLYVNPELNASNAFLAAWLPGSEGGGVADVLFTDAAGNTRYDFTGRLSYSWPKRPDQAVLNVGDADYDPLFAYGTGLSYGDDGNLEELPTDYVVAGGGSDIVFDEGSSGDWRMSVVTAYSPPVQVEDVTAETQDGALRLSRIDREAQEDSLVLDWSGAAEASFIVSGGPVDWSRQANGELALQVDYRLDEPLSGPISLGMGCGEDCGADFTLPGTDSVGEWQSATIRLSCFGDAGLDLTAIDRPLVLTSAADNKLSMSFAGLATSPGGTACPE